MILFITQSIYAQSEEIRGVWLTNVDSRVLECRESIAEAMQFLADHNFNLVCPVVWNKGMTQYRSQVMDSLFDLPIDPEYDDRDPLAELIEEAHLRNIAVIAWFEFGFSSSYQDCGGHILDRFPEWAAKDADGDLLEKNGFEWMNAYHPEVQNLILSLMREVAVNYDVDGVQGDDRLPAQPSHGGYSGYTINRYRAEHAGKDPPEAYDDPDWLRWRGNILNNFAYDIYQLIKGIDSRILVTWAPSIYPWSYQEYLQDWPAWLREGNADLIITQNYRYSLYEYQEVLEEQMAYADAIPGGRAKLFSGMLINVGDYIISEELLLASMQYNRSQGLNGEVFFFYEGLRKDDDLLAKSLYKHFYSEPVKLPFVPRFRQLNKDVQKIKK